MGKISPMSVKYIIRAKLKLSGRAEKPDVIGAIFGQTEGLLGADLELRELQKSGRIGRIDVDVKTRKGKSYGEIRVPSSLAKSETALVAAALETIDKIGPCNADIKVKEIEDVRVSKRKYVVKRAKELLKKFVETMPDATALAKDVSETVRAMDMTKYGRDKLPASKGIGKADKIIIVEGRADVIQLLKYGIHNVIGLNGSKAPRSIVRLAKGKTATVFVDGDRGGNLILKNLASMINVNYVARAPDGKEVEELTFKEINKALRKKRTLKEYADENDKFKIPKKSKSRSSSRKSSGKKRSKKKRSSRSRSKKRKSSRKKGRRKKRKRSSKSKLSSDEKKEIKKITDELVGTKGAYLLDSELEILGKVPVTELKNTLQNMDSVYAIVMDGYVGKTVIKEAENKDVEHLIAKTVRGKSRSVDLVKASSL